MVVRKRLLVTDDLREPESYGPSHQLNGLKSPKKADSWHATSTRNASFVRNAFTSFP